MADITDDNIALTCNGPLTYNPLIAGTNPATTADSFENTSPAITAVTQPPAGQGTVTFSGNSITYTPPATYSGTTTFTYTVTSGSKTETATESVTSVTALSTTNTKTDINCFGTSTGAINLSVSGGTSPYTYAWTGPAGFAASSEDLNAIPAGTYNVTITDAKSCTATASVTLTHPEATLLKPNTKTNIKNF